MTKIHPTAIIDPKAELDSSVSVGAYTVIGPNVQIDSNTEIGPHVVIDGHTTIGSNNRIFQFASLGAIPQDKKYRDEPTKLIIGNNNTIREFTTFNTGTVTGIGETRIGGFSLVHQFCIIGDYAMTAFAAGVHKDVPPYVMAAGYRAEPAGLNTEGLRRHHFTPEQINNIKRLYKILYRQGLNYSDAQAKIIAEADSAPELQVFKEFFKQSTRGVIR